MPTLNIEPTDQNWRLVVAVWLPLILLRPTGVAQSMENKLNISQVSWLAPGITHIYFIIIKFKLFNSFDNIYRYEIIDKKVFFIYFSTNLSKFYLDNYFSMIYFLKMFKI